VDTNPDDDVRSPARPAPAPDPPCPAGPTLGAPPSVGVIIGCCRLCVEAAPILRRSRRRAGDDLADGLRIAVSR
jgi:hypothetical protein